MDYVKVRHGAVALLFPGLILKLLQGDPLGVGVDTQHLGRLGGGERGGGGGVNTAAEPRTSKRFLYLAECNFKITK